jgi:exodeoxyribonuclease X
LSIIRVVDMEFDGKPEDGGGVCDIGYYDLVARDTDLVGNPCNWNVGEGKSRLCNPGRAISPETQAVHFIDDADVAGEPDWQSLMRAFVNKAQTDGVIAFAAHSFEAEQQWIHPDWLQDKPIPFICTLKAAYWVWPEAPAHKNQVLRFWRRPQGLLRELAEPAHRALADAYVTAHLLRDFLNDEHISLEQLLDWTNRPALLPRCKMGDYRDANGGAGVPWSEVDDGLLHWVIRKNISEDAVFTAKHWLEQHELDQREAAERGALHTQMEANGLAVQPTQPEQPAINPLTDERQGELL